MQTRQIFNENDNDAQGAFFIDGKQYYVSFPVIHREYEERGYSFESPIDLKENYGVRNNEGINCIVLHWDVCESVRHCFITLCQRGLSAHIMIDEDGSVYQILDLIKLANHAKGCNHNSIGIMLQNPVIASNNDNVENRNLTTSREPGNNKPYTHLDFTDEQKEMVVKVCDDLCRIFPDIPRILPPLDEKKLITTVTLPREERIGILAHYNATPTRLGPGDSLWLEFCKAGYVIRD
ncbi:N-acetylmuramoyl-L-alanine amidase domain-containing protein [Glomus cerebriforme]|uniref:N-acetylmuramoyl-L-alanine amidase domain-containing protein n=1 Tax=Glomus cerebriforme TaxID=658196 RepID=A0A397SHC0_9GLOM|nr:N-acetylmuramoyl-L-alanine amidase domain-containing protein [Glomus cerebriforme]